MEVIYLPKAEGFVRSLDPVAKNQTLVMVDMLEEMGYLLKMPFSKSLGKGLFELRVVGNNHVRIFYCFCGGKVYLLHGISKKTQRIPPKETAFARRVKKMLES
ncbi:MAG TPA: type II toxin-antitoxin system RelE/ParE family toxin [Candidatus Taylorbacteria bacterium]|nr:MAG: hypothetical protein UY03_C0011G0003 [Parcubacteria group bacterium GW2011_GWA2_47_64]KKU95687.1 MAG: hypothetical protein UY29_C0021G0007 [Parcubacteria group bacterium GW2011_GWC2_48_17]HBV00898.1 type II toxin-antitoxin system RelE/ParE family toxin [Candidatus Taylorbacteria bacterium]